MREAKFSLVARTSAFSAFGWRFGQTFHRTKVASNSSLQYFEMLDI
jgi:hypothetical protein